MQVSRLALALWAAMSASSASAGADWFRASQPQLPVISLRALEPAGGKLEPNDERGELRYVKVSAHVVQLNGFGEQLDELPVYLPDRWTDTEQVEVVGEEGLYRLLFADAGRPVLYIHGYNESFDKSVKRALWLRQQLQLEGRLVLFSWPSDGNVLNYTRDEADLYWSVPYLRRAIEGLAARYGEGGFDIIAHSLGGRGVALALAQLHDTRPAGGAPVVGQTILVAPDMDVQVFADLQHKVVASTERLSLYSSELDEPLAISETLHGYPRLGQSGAHSQRLQGLDVIDVSEVPRRRPTGHNYHLGSPVIQADMRAILAGRPAAQRAMRPRVGERHWQLLPE